MRISVVMKDTLDYINAELVSVHSQLSFVSNNIEYISMRHKCCQQIEESLNKLRDLIKETDTKWEENR